MKKIFFILSAALCVAAVSCNKNEISAQKVDQPLEKVQLSVGIKSPVTTKVTEVGTDAENTVSNIQIWVFKDNGGTKIYEASAKASASSLNLTVTTGTKYLIAIVNEADDLTALTDYATVLASANYLKDNGASAFMMGGTQTYEVTSSAHATNIPVNRVAARFKIKKITNDLGDLADKNVKVRRAYLSHVAQQNDYNLNKAAVNFYATTGVNSLLDLDGVAVDVAAEKTAVNGFAYASIASSVIADGASYTTPIVMYGYPNDGATQKTHLVVEMEIDSKYYTYPIELAAVAANNSYEIDELVLRRTGNPSDGDDDITEGDEDDPISTLTATFGVAVQPWEVNLLANGTGADDGKYVI